MLLVVSICCRQKARLQREEKKGVSYRSPQCHTEQPSTPHTGGPQYKPHTGGPQYKPYTGPGFTHPCLMLQTSDVTDQITATLPNITE